MDNFQNEINPIIETYIHSAEASKSPNTRRLDLSARIETLEGLRNSANIIQRLWDGIITARLEAMNYRLQYYDAFQLYVDQYVGWNIYNNIQLVYKPEE